MVDKRAGTLCIALGIVLLVTIAVIAVYYENYTRCVSDEILADDFLGEIVEGDIYAQTLTCDRNNLKSIKLKLATYNRLNNCTLSVALMQGGNTSKMEYQLYSVTQRFILYFNVG